MTSIPNIAGSLILASQSGVDRPVHTWWGNLIFELVGTSSPGSRVSRPFESYIAPIPESDASASRFKEDSRD